MQLILGIDTSNYTTSLCAVDFDSGELVAEQRKLLPVRGGERGLRQSDALFFHVQQLPEVMDGLMRQLIGRDVHWRGVGVSVRPRPQAASYMPVFRSGESFALTFARALGVPVVRTSHQEGHLAAAQYCIDDIPSGAPFIGVHLSGGTSDVLLAEPTRFGYRIWPFAEGADLHAGQFVDRVGVALGLPFPAGPHLEKLAQEAEGSEFRIGARLVGKQLSFSGPCSAALRAIEQGVPPAEVAYAVEACIANAVAKAVSLAAKEHPDVRYCVIAGGVAANAYIRSRVTHRLRMEAPLLAVRFAPPKFSSDNALGVACIARAFLRGANLPASR
jgi:N6-L-threonylcarbamoyladenine synthase